MGRAEVVVRSFAFVVGLGSLFAVPAFAEDTASVVARVEAKYAKVTVLQASFVQVTHSEAFGDDKQAGNITLKRPKQMVWDFGTKKFVTDGKTMWIYTAEDNQVIRYDNVGASGGSSADQLLTSLDQLDSLFNITQVADTTGHTFDLLPKSPGQVKKIHLELSTDLVVEKVSITDSFDSVTDLSFKDVKLNADVPDSAFVFAVPAGATVISAGGK